MTARMHQKPRKVTRQVRLLRDPEPQYVSLVGHAATQTPFLALKSARPIKPGEAPMLKQRTATKAPLKKPVAKDASRNTPEKDAEIRKISFAKTQFKTQKSVEDYLEANDYDGYELSEEKDMYVASASNLTDEDFSDIRAINMEKGITGFVGQLTPEAKETVGKSRETRKSTKKSDEAEPTLESVSKMDWWAMYVSTAQTPKQILEDGMADGLPPGLSVIMEAVQKAMANTLGGDATVEEKKTQLGVIGQEMAELIGSVYELFDTALNLSDKTASVAKFVEAYTNDLEASKMATKTDDKTKQPAVTDTSKKDEKLQAPANKEGEKESEKKSEPTAEAAAAETTEKADDTTASAPVVATGFDMDKFTQGIGDAISKAVAPLSTAVETLSKRLDENEKAVKEMGDRTQSRKSAEDANEPSDRAPVKRSDGHNRLRANMGIVS